MNEHFSEWNGQYIYRMYVLCFVGLFLVCIAHKIFIGMQKISVLPVWFFSIYYILFNIYFVFFLYVDRVVQQRFVRDGWSKGKNGKEKREQETKQEKKEAAIISTPYTHTHTRTYVCISYNYIDTRYGLATWRSRNNICCCQYMCTQCNGMVAIYIYRNVYVQREKKYLCIQSWERNETHIRHLILYLYKYYIYIHNFFYSAFFCV